jgi:signal transduction histidine kinase
MTSPRRRAERTLAEREEQLAKLLAERESFLESERVARSEAERLSHVKDEFLATLSHELRTPLNAIQGWATLLRGRKVSAEDRERGLETIERNVRIQAQIVNDLLDMSRIVSGKVHLEVQPLYLHEVVNDAIDTVRQSATARTCVSSSCWTQVSAWSAAIRVACNRCCGIFCRMR